MTSLCRVTDLPVNVDAEQCFPADPGGVAETVARLAEAGAAGGSIEDWDPRTQAIETRAVAVDRVGEAAAAAARSGLVLTARAENHLRGRDDLDDTVARLAAYASAGADVVYAPGLTDLSAITRVVEEAGAPVNVLLIPGGPRSPSWPSRRPTGLGGRLPARVAYGALVQAAEQLQASGSLGPELAYLDRSQAATAFAPPGELRPAALPQTAPPRRLSTVAPMAADRMRAAANGASHRPKTKVRTANMAPMPRMKGQMLDPGKDSTVPAPSATSASGSSSGWGFSGTTTRGSRSRGAARGGPTR